MAEEPVCCKLQPDLNDWRTHTVQMLTDVSLANLSMEYIINERYEILHDINQSPFALRHAFAIIFFTYQIFGVSNEVHCYLGNSSLEISFIFTLKDCL